MSIRKNLSFILNINHILITSTSKLLHKITKKSINFFLLEFPEKIVIIGETYMSQRDTNDNENVIARLVLNEVKELDKAIQRGCFAIARNDRKRVWGFSREKPFEKGYSSFNPLSQTFYLP
jgi:hypothetical protein